MRSPCGAVAYQSWNCRCNVGANGACTTEGLQELAGQPATSELGAEAMRRSGARALRWIRPGDAVTMDYRQDRLNVRLDAENRVEGFDCG